MKPGLPTRNPLEWLDRSGECWLWLGDKDPQGYGRMSKDMKTVRAHRIVYELLVGPIPEGLFLLHSCDTPACCNPAHLRPGTKADNYADARQRGRNTCGEKQAKAKLTAEAVREIRAARERGEKVVVIARRYGVTHQTVCKVANGQQWRHVA